MELYIFFCFSSLPTVAIGTVNIVQYRFVNIFNGYVKAF